ncbi:MAG: phosphoribulokinase [Clostridia bacterium]|nr:phosphoribulokinase [Clostridia bacterium]
MISGLETLVERINGLRMQKERVIVAIEGDCTAGKTTLATALHTALGGNLFHTDDFFLRSEQRTQARRLETGGNFDRERFRAEVIEPLVKGEAFCYRPYDCRQGKLSEPVAVSRQKINVVEGSYSLHPYLGNYFDLAVFMEISPSLQRARVEKRDIRLRQRFFEEWIPMEKAYFDGFQIKRRCDITIKAEEKNDGSD